MKEKITENIYRIKIPFENIFTSAFIIKTKNHTLVVDSGCGEYDVSTYILPHLDKDVDIIIMSHHHPDHDLGLTFLHEKFPNALIYSGFDYRLKNNIIINNQINIDDEIILIPCKGHTDDSIVIYDKRDKTLLSFDCLQGYGIGRFSRGISNINEYKKSVNKLLNMDINLLVAAHEFDIIGDKANGEEAVNKYINASLSI